MAVRSSYNFHMLYAFYMVLQSVKNSLMMLQRKNPCLKKCAVFPYESPSLQMISQLALI